MTFINTTQFATKLNTNTNSLLTAAVTAAFGRISIIFIILGRFFNVVFDVNAVLYFNICTLHGAVERCVPKKNKLFCENTARFAQPILLRLYIIKFHCRTIFTWRGNRLKYSSLNFNITGVVCGGGEF